MGGAAFAQAVATGHPVLNTPRMSPAEYTFLRDTYLCKIRAYFSDQHPKVAVLKEAPEKQSYGDIDIFIALDQPVDLQALANAVGATGLIIHSTGEAQKCTIGVMKNGNPSSQPTVEYTTIQSNSTDNLNCSTASAEVTPEEYAQIDLNVIPTDLVDWHMFYSAYGDLNGLLGHIVTHLGFTVTDKGLWLRLKELDAAKSIERANIADHIGKLFLSSNAEEVMRFLGLSVEKWDAGFATLDDFYDWLGACRMLHPVAIKLRRDKAHERKREEKRDVYRRFFFEWLPKRMLATEMTYDKEQQRQEIAELRRKYLAQALDFFDKRAGYEELHRSVVAAVNNAIASNLLRPIITKHSNAAGKKLGELVRAFRRFVRFGEESQPYLSQAAHTDAESQLQGFLDERHGKFKDEGAAEEFVRLNWQKAKELERSRAKKTGADECREDGEGL